MKSTKILFLEKILRLMAQAVLKRHKPKIVAITGSVGKSSAKAAVFTVLASKYRVRENYKNYNNEIGIPLTIIGAQSGGKNPFLWGWVLVKWVVSMLYANYPEILVLELGVDRPSDMNYFMSFIKPMVGVVTNVSTSHLEYFKSVDNIAKEKRVLVESLDTDNWAILNADNEKTLHMKEHTKAQIVTFGFDEQATVNASNIVYNYQANKPDGISFKLNYEGKNVPIRLRHILAPHQIPAALVALSVGMIFKINLVEIAQALENLQSPVGRMNLLSGINGSYLIDDTYNASPVSTMAALDVLAQLQATRKIAVLGDMLELGSEEQAGHRAVGKKVFESKVDLFVAVGDRMQAAVEELVSLGYNSSQILKFNDPTVAAEKLQKLIREGDYVLIKGSQGMRMEKIVEALLENPGRASELLCRQNPAWKNKPFARP